LILHSAGGSRNTLVYVFKGVLYGVLTFVALNLWVTTPTSWTEANRSGVLYATLGISGTWVGLGTRILAAFIDAGRGRLAFRIVGAASLDFSWKYNTLLVDLVLS